MALENLNDVYDGIGIPPPEENPFPKTPGVAFNPMATGKVTAGTRDYNPSDYTNYFQAPVYENQGDINLRRGELQSGWDKTGNAIVQTVGKIGTQLLDMAGGIGSLITEWGDDRDYKNDFTQAADDSNAWLAKNFPLYRSTNDTFGLTDMSWWLENASGLTASVAGFAIGGAGIAGGLGALGKFAKVGSALEAALGTISELGTAKSLVQGAEKTLTAGMLAYLEGAMSGRRVFDEVYQTQLKAGKTDDEAKHIAAQSAATTVQLNTIINTGMNLAGGMDMFFNHEKNKVIDVAKKTFGRRADETGEAWIKRLGEETANKYARELGTDMGLMGMGKKGLTMAREATAEGVEELTNQFAERTGIEEGNKGKIYGLAEQLGQLSNYFNRTMDKEGALNFVMGAIAGPIQNTAASLAPIHKVETGTSQNTQGELTDQEGNTTQSTSEAGKTYQENKVFKGWNRISQLEKNKSMTNKFFLDIKDKVVEDAKFLHDTELAIKKAILDGNPLEAERLKSDYFNVMNFQSVALGMADNLKETYRSIASLDNTKDNTTELQSKVSTLQQTIDDTKSKGGDTTELDLQLKQAETDLAASKGQTAAMKLGFTDSMENNEYKEKAEKAIKNLEAIQKIHDDTQKKYGFDKELSNLEQGHIADFIFQQKANLYLLEQDLSDKQNELAQLDTPEVSSSTVESEFRRQLLREQEIGRQYDRAASRKENVNADIELFNAYLEDKATYDKVEPVLRKYGTVSPTPDGIKEAVKKTSDKLKKIRDGVSSKMEDLGSSLLETDEYLAWSKKNPGKAFADYADDLAKRYQDTVAHRQLAEHVEELKTRISTQSDALAEMTTGKTLDKVLKNTKNYFDKLQKEYKARQDTFNKQQAAALASAQKRKEAIILQQKILQKKYHKELEQIKERLSELINRDLELIDEIKTVEMLPSDYSEWNKLIEEQKKVKAEIDTIMDRITVLETLYNQAEQVINPPPPPSTPPPPPNNPPPPPTGPVPPPSGSPVPPAPPSPSTPVPSLDDDTDLPDVPEVDPTLGGPPQSTTPMADAYMMVLNGLQAPEQIALEKYRKELMNGAPFSLNTVSFVLDNKVPREKVGEIALALRNFVGELGIMLNDISDTVDAATTAMDVDLPDVPVVEATFASLETEGLVVADNSEEEMTLPDDKKKPWGGLKQLNPETAGASRSTIYFTKLSDGSFKKLSTPLLDPNLNPKVIDPVELLPGTKVRVRLDVTFNGLVNDTSIDPTQNTGGVKQMESKFEDFLDTEGKIDLEKIGNVPIVFEDDNGNSLQWLHRVDWVKEQINGESEDNPDRFKNVVDEYTVGDQVVTDNVARAAAELTNIRRALVQQYNNGNKQGIETVVKEKSAGQLVLSDKPLNALQNLGVASDIKLGFVKDEKSLAGGVDTSLMTNTNFSEAQGRTVALIPAANGEFIPTILTSKPLGESNKDKNTFIRAVELLLNPVQEEVDFIKNTSGFDVSTNQGFRAYILQYFTYFTTEASFMTKAGLGSAIDSQGFIQGKPRVVIMTKGEGIVNSVVMEVDESGALTFDSYKAIVNFLNGRHRSPALSTSKFKGLNSTEKFSIPLYIQGEWRNSDHQNYNKFLLFNMETKVTFAKNSPGDTNSGFKVDELGRKVPVFRYAVNPIIQYNLDSVLSTPGDLSIPDEFTPTVNPAAVTPDDATLVFDDTFDFSLDSKVQSVGTNDKPSIDIKSLEKLFTFTPQSERNGKTPLEIQSYYQDIGVTHLPDGFNPFRKC